ncbi:hypothetical protein OIU78_017899 [Salix suchowensis]|nr:hypothetical protein OIU78_017899 [Salix suchowensis]
MTGQPTISFALNPLSLSKHYLIIKEHSSTIKLTLVINFFHISSSLLPLLQALTGISANELSPES